ncbi:hypothetical protein E4U53_000829, partial [Claviceps sorghi]
ISHPDSPPRLLGLRLYLPRNHRLRLLHLQPRDAAHGIHHARPLHPPARGLLPPRPDRHSLGRRSLAGGPAEGPRGEAPCQAAPLQQALGRVACAAPDSGVEQGECVARAGGGGNGLHGGRGGFDDFGGAGGGV